jgi:hypothetical protein
MQKTVTIPEPFGPINLPKKPELTELSKGKKINIKYTNYFSKQQWT